MKKLVLMLIVLSLMAGSAFAYTANYQFTLAGSTQAITEATIGGIGSTLDLSIWVKSDIASITGSAIFYGWDNATTAGTAAVKTDNKLVGSLGLNLASGWTSLPANSLQGGKKTTGTRPYGTYVAGSRELGGTYDLSGWTRMFDITLTNANLAAGQSYVTTIWDNPGTNGPGGETYLSTTAGTKYAPSATYNLTVSRQVIPEPATLVGLLAFAPALIAVAKRKKA